MTKKYRIILALVAAQLTFAQTQINLPTQARNVDFSGAPSTKPAQTGTTLPAACSTGAVFISLSSPAGQNIYVCTSANIWSLEAGGGSGSSSASTPNTLAVSAAGSVLSIGANCSSASPCNVRIGGTVYAFINGMTATLASGTGSAYLFVASSGLMTVGHNMSLNCSGGCVAQPGITSFPVDAYPIGLWTASNGIWNPGGIDVRAILGRDLVTAGVNLTSASSGGATTLSAPSQAGGFAVAFRGSDVVAGSTVYITIPYSCTITDWAVTSDGTATIKLWRVIDGGTALPNAGGSLNATGFSLTTGTRIHSTNLSDLSSTSIFAFDTFGVNLLAVSSASHVEFYLGCAR